MSSSNLFDLTGKIAAVIGGASGIGEAVTLGAAGMGATTICLDVKQDAAAATAAKAGGSTEAGVIDITDAASVNAALDAIVARHGRLDILICTPSINVRKKILDYQHEELMRVLNVNIAGNFNVLQAAGRIMVPQQKGSIVLFSSIRSLVVEPGQALYSATKAGILQLARGAACEFGPSGVRVNCVGPGVVETPLTAPIKANPDWYNAYAAKNAFNRWARPEEMVGPTLFLASDAASYVNGTIIYADGGWLAQDGRFTPPGM
ncbi:SDR family oxidoreductase [Gemmatimonas aurantiaca]|uniref:SDR family NAD(P)-dependent oxidoreductase n=1 Tax=Gemmatimonas aurantiaca TaxID=173480 RepID=UPI00301E5D98